MAAVHDPTLCGISPDCPGCKAEAMKPLFAALRSAAELCPEEFREILSSVFTVQEMEKHAEFAKRVSQEALTLASNARLAAQDAAQRLDDLHGSMDDFAMRMQKAREWVKALRAGCLRVYNWAKKQPGFKDQGRVGAAPTKGKEPK